VRLARPDPVVREGSPVVLAVAGERTLAFVTDAGEGRVHLIDVDAAREITTTPVTGAGTALLLADGRVAVASNSDAAVSVLRLDAEDTLQVDARWETGAAATALALGPDDRTLFVATGAVSADAGMLEMRDVATGARVGNVPLADAPAAVTVDPDGHAALVAHAAASALTVVDIAQASTKRADLDVTGQEVEPAGMHVLEPVDTGGKPVWTPAYGMGTLAVMQSRNMIPARARHTNAFAAVDEFTYVAHEVMVPTAPAGGVGFPGGGENAGYGGSSVLSSTDFVGVSILERKTGKRISFHHAETGCRLPRGQAFDKTRRMLLVACAGSSTFAALKWSPNVEFDQGHQWREEPSFVTSASLSLPGPGDGVALDAAHERAVVSTLFGGALEIVDLALLGNAVARPAAATLVALSGGDTGADAVARGRRIFYRTGDTRVARDGRACASCHIDGLTDGLTWATPRGPRSTPVLAGRLDREGPFGWNGESKTLDFHVAATIRNNLRGRGLPAADIADLVAYLRAMPAPQRHDPPPSEALLARGAEVFAADVAGCAACHTAGHSDGTRHDVKSGGSFVTPSLVGLTRSAPYFHDGRYKTLDDLLAKAGDAMGTTRALPENDREALTAYLRTL
jgi:mono/diheme cytochrome c family protein